MFDPISLGLAGLSFGGSLLSGMGASQGAAKQARLQAIADANAAQANFETLQRVNAIRTQLGEKLIAASDPKVAVAEAEAAGFNPVTWLSAGYGARVGALSDAYRLQVPEYSLVQASQVPQQHSMLSAFGGALSAGANTLGTQYRANQSYELQMGRLAAQAGTGLSNLSPYLPGYGGSAGGGLRMSSGGAASSGGSLSSSLGWPDHGSWKPGKNEVTAWSPVAPVDPYSADVGGSLTQRGGEPYEWLFFGPTLLSDTLKSWTGKGLYEWGVHNGASIGPYRKSTDVGIGPAISRWWNDPKTDHAITNWWKGMGSGFSGSVTPYMPFPGANAY